MSWMDWRRLCPAGMCSGWGQWLLERALRRAQERHSGGRPIADLQAIQHLLAGMDSETYQARATSLVAQATLDELGPFDIPLHRAPRRSVWSRSSMTRPFSGWPTTPRRFTGERHFSGFARGDVVPGGTNLRIPPGRGNSEERDRPSAAAVEMIELGCVTGRFQPVHCQHMELFEMARHQCGHLIVAVTNPDPGARHPEPTSTHRHTAAANPFTYYERVRLSTAAFEVQELAGVRHDRPLRPDAPGELARIRPPPGPALRPGLQRVGTGQGAAHPCRRLCGDGDRR